MLLSLLTFLNSSEPGEVRTFFGWTPGLRRLVEGSVLECGCLVGTYTDWRDQLVSVLDERAAGCTHEEHRRNAVLGG